jgi:hypothetical protein
MSTTMTTKRIPTTRLGATIGRWAPVVAVLILALVLGFALVQPGTTAARPTETRNELVDNTLSSSCHHKMTASPPGPICGAASAADVAAGDDVGRPHGFVHRQSRGNCIVLPKRGIVCAGQGH